jgi:hypothetical protein
VARWRPLSDARWGEPIVRSLACWCAVASVLAYLVGIALAAILTGGTALDPVVQGLAAGLAAAVAAITATLGVRRRVTPLFEAVEWALALARARWASLGVADGIPASGAGLEVLASRTDEPAMAAKGAALAALGRADELEALLQSWTPDTATAAAAIARQRVNLDGLRGRPADPGPALAAAAAIPDLTARTNATALVHIDTANREARAGRSPELALRAVRSVVGAAPSDVPVPFARNLAVMTLWLTLIGSAIPIAVAVLIAAGVAGLAVWVAVVAVVVVATRLRYRVRAT